MSIDRMTEENDTEAPIEQIVSTFARGVFHLG
jgi:hypothetical protein